MSLDSSEFRRILGHFTTGVTVVTTLDSTGAPKGLTLNAFASLSLDPPLVLVCIDRSADTHDIVARTGVFVVNVLAGDQERVARRFAGDEAQRRFDGIGWRRETTGAPVLDDVLAWIECRVRDAVDGGDHTIFVGDVVAADAREGAPLAFYRGGYARLSV